VGYFFLELALLLPEDFGLAADFTFFAPLHPHLLHMLHPFIKRPHQRDKPSYSIGVVAGDTLTRAGED
jgi:hypothetical protein